MSTTTAPVPAAPALETAGPGVLVLDSDPEPPDPEDGGGPLAVALVPARGTE